MAENLNYNAKDSRCYGNNIGNCAIYGRLYSRETAMEACPEGWRLSSDGDWDALITAVGWETAGKYLKATNGWSENGNGEDTYGFSALPGGYGYSGGSFYGVGEYGYWMYEEYGYSYMYGDLEYVIRDVTKINYSSVRCVKD